jgi:riboflavin synthase
VTTLGTVVPGDPVNLEVDMIAKYVERLLVPDAGLTEDTEHDGGAHDG